MSESAKERQDTVDFWQKHYNDLVGLGGVPEEGLRWLSICCLDPNNIGYEQGEIRPGKLGQWDLYFFLSTEGGLKKVEALIVSGLTVEEVAHQEDLEEMREYGVDPDNPREVADFRRRQDATPEEMDAEIERLQAQLAEAGG